MYAENADFQVAWLPLSEESRAVFNETAAIEKFYELEGLPYGFHTFLSTWVDTPE